MNKPYIKLLMMGISVKELVKYALEKDEYVCHGEYDSFWDKEKKLPIYATPEKWWEHFIQLLVASKDKNIRFIEDTPDLEHPDSVDVFAPKLNLPSIYYDDSTLHHAEEDIANLNNFVKDFYGVQSKPVKPKITNQEYALKKKCPVCKKQKGIRQQGYVWVVGNYAHRSLGCDLCNSTWQENFVIESFEKVDVR